MPIPHDEMRRIIRRRVQGTEGAERIRVLERLLDRIRVWPAPGGRRDTAPVVLPRAATVADFVRAVDGRWLDHVRRARVSGPSARFPGQAMGLAHGLEDGDEVDVVLRA
jgi:ribosome-interacting GTPase 1